MREKKKKKKLSLHLKHIMGGRILHKKKKKKKNYILSEETVLFIYQAIQQDLIERFPDRFKFYKQIITRFLNE